jgi:hypothetical protein
LWGSLKEKILFNPHTLEELETSIREEITKISKAELQRLNKMRFNATTPVYQRMANIFSISCEMVNLCFSMVNLPLTVLVCCFRSQSG